MQHGAYGYWNWPIIRYVDGVMSDYKLVGGEGAARYLTEVECSGCKPVPTGLITLDAVVKRRRGPRRPGRGLKVVYPLASYAKNFIPYSNSRLAQTEYFEVNRAILRVLGRHPEVNVLVRPHPGRPFRENASSLQEWAALQSWAHIVFDSSGSAVDMLLDADVIIIDSPSTVMMQAVATDRKVLIFNRAFPLTGQGLASIRKRVSYSEDLEEFLGRLEDTLDRQDFDAGGPDEEFLRLYGTHLNDGDSVRRAAEFVRSVALGRHD
jgi:hypothetical protein